MTTSDKTVAHALAMFAGVDSSFRQLLLSEEAQVLLAAVLEAIDLEKTSPVANNIFGFARYGRLDDIKVVIIGQDPYPDKSHAHGLSFSSLDKKLPKSLFSVFDCLEESGFLPREWRLAQPERPGDLSEWARQGVLLINTALTIPVGSKAKTNEHIKIWKKYMEHVIAKIGAIDRPMVFMLWGGKAQAFQRFITNGRACILTEVHPSPLSQSALPEKEKFRYCNHFTKANEYLLANGLTAINWCPWKEHEARPMAEVKEEKVDVKHVMFTDGSASANGTTSGRAGYAVWFSHGPLAGTKLTGRIAPVTSIVGEGEGKIFWPTNIRAEGYAIAIGLEYALANNPDLLPVEVVTDSQFWINMIEKFIPAWIAAKSPLDTKENSDLVKRMWKIAQEIRAVCALELRHVKSHGKDVTISAADYKGNDLCDKWATKARLAADFFDKVERLDTKTFAPLPTAEVPSVSS